MRGKLYNPPPKIIEREREREREREMKIEKPISLYICLFISY